MSLQKGCRVTASEALETQETEIFVCHITWFSPASPQRGFWGLHVKSSPSPTCSTFSSLSATRCRVCVSRRMTLAA